MNLQRAVVLLSGGLDSATTLAMALDAGFECIALTFNYSQRHTHELAAAKRVVERARVTEHVILSLDLRAIGGSALTSDIPVPKGRDPSHSTEIPATYVPARNSIFLAIAAALAEVRGARDIFIGVNALDYSGYPDCRPEFIAAMEYALRLGTRAGLEGATIAIHAPLVAMTKAEIIQTGTNLGVDYSLTHSCYDPAKCGAACGTCDSCRLRKDGFARAGLPDPTSYAIGSLGD